MKPFERLKSWRRPARAGVASATDAHTVTPAQPPDAVVPEDVLSGIQGLERAGAGVVLPAREPAPVTVVAPAPEPAPIDALDRDTDDISKPPRSPDMIRRLIAAGETEAQRARRIVNDKQRSTRRRFMQ